MGSLGAPELLILLVVALLIFGGYKKLPDASRSLGRSLRIFRGEMKGMKDDGATPARPQLPTPVAPPVATASDDVAARLEEEARIAEAHAAELRARARQAASGTVDGLR